MNTFSEQQFEHFCDTKGIRWDRIPESDMRLADYRVWLDKNVVIAEVKQLDLNDEDQALIKAVQDGKEIPPGFRATGHIRVRNALDDAYDQLKNAAERRCPAILVIYDNTQGLSHLEHNDILNAMYGDEAATVAWSAQEPAKSDIIAHRFGGNRRVTRNSYRALSGIGLLRMDKTNAYLTLDLFHNVHATNRLEFSLGWSPANRQFIIEDTEKYGEWIEIAK
jgi:hypothetical protein